MKDIEGYEGLYAVTEDGKVFSYDKPTGQHGRFLKPHHRKNSYPTVHLSKKSRVKAYMVHRLVANAFLEKNKRRPEVNHKNGIKTDNRIENLEWTTRLENNRHAWRIGLCKPNIANSAKGERNGNSKLTKESIKKIRNLRRKGATCKTLSEKFSVSVSLISNICLRQV